MSLEHRITVWKTMCLRKKAFSQAAAEHVAKKFGQRSYLCPHCGSWHCTKAPDLRARAVAKARSLKEAATKKSEADRQRIATALKRWRQNACMKIVHCRWSQQKDEVLEAVLALIDPAFDSHPLLSNDSVSAPVAHRTEQPASIGTVGSSNLSRCTNGGAA